MKEVISDQERARQLLSAIMGRIVKGSADVETFTDMWSVLYENEVAEKRELKGDPVWIRYRSEWWDWLHNINKEYRKYLGIAIRKASSFGQMDKLFDLYKASLLMDAPYDFDSYMLYLEIKRNPADKFYQNRRRALFPIVEKLQRMADGELDELFLSQPPRTGKTSLLIFFMTWLIGRDSEHPNLYSSYSDKITGAFYNGVKEIVEDADTYLYNDVFPGKRIVRSDANDEILDFDRRKHYPTLTCRSLYGTLNGACDAEKGIIIADDLIGGIEEAMNKERLMSAWAKVDNNLIPRGKSGTRFIWCGTRWSLIDPAGLRLDLLENDDKFEGHRFEVLNIPALNENDESNFDYDNGVGFNTLYYQQRRASFERNNDLASWQAQYMGEPVEREGALFTPNDFRYYNGELPDGEPDRIFMAVDPAYGGGDFVAGPVCVQYGEDVYVPDVVFNDADKKVTQPSVAEKVERNGVTALQIEGTKATEGYKEGVESILTDHGYKLNITTKAAPPNASKMDRICGYAPDIRDHFIFLESGKRNGEYSRFMQNVFGYKLYAKKQHDDAPDSLAQAADMVFKPQMKRPEFFKRFM